MYDHDSYTQEELNLFNPAYTGFLLLIALRNYTEHCPDGMPCLLPYVLMPIVLSSQINCTLPTTSRTPLAAWAVANEGALVGFPKLAESYVPIVNAAIRFLSERGVITLVETGHYQIALDSLAKNPPLFGERADMKKSLLSARLLGKWFSISSSLETIYAHLGVRP